MRLRLAVLALCLVLVPVAAAALPFKAKLTAGTHTPKVNTKWPYSVRVTTLKGKPTKATITVQIVDPTGSVHAVQFGNTTKNVTNWPVVGVFRDFVIWPPDSTLANPLGGLTFRVIVKARGGRAVLRYQVRPQ